MIILNRAYPPTTGWENFGVGCTARHWGKKLMGKFDSIFKSEETATENLSPEEAVAAVAVIAAKANSTVVELEMVEDTLLQLEIFDEYSEDEISEIVKKLADTVNKKGLGALFSAAYQGLGEEFSLDAFAVAVALFVEDGEVPTQQQLFLKELQEALEIEEEEAEAVIHEVIAELSEEDEEDSEASEEEELGNVPRLYGESGSDNWYESPLGNFRVPIPVETERGGRINEQENTVGFSDDFGTLLRIDYYSFPAEAEEELDSMGAEDFLKSLLGNYVSEGILDIVPGSQVLYEEYLEDVGDGAYFIVVDMPQGSTLSVQKGEGAAIRANAYRGLISFVLEGFLYTVSSQRHFWEGETPGTLESEVEGVKEKILVFLETIEFAAA